MNARERFAVAYRIQRLMKHRFACAAVMKNFHDTEMLKLALKCHRFPDNYLTCGGVWFARQAAKNGRSFKTAIRLYLRAAHYRRWAHAALMPTFPF